MTPILRADAISYSYQQRTVIDCFSLCLSRGEILCVLGPSGSGKSTLLRILAGILVPHSGTVTRSLSRPDSIGYCDQDARPVPWLSVRDNVTFRSRLTGAPLPDSKQISAHLDRADLNHLAARYPYQLSGGEAQRVCLLQALWNDPELLILDEPFSKLDLELRLRIAKELRAYITKHQQAAVIVTHNRDEATLLADEIVDLTSFTATNIRHFSPGTYQQREALA